MGTTLRPMPHGGIPIEDRTINIGDWNGLLAEITLDKRVFVTAECGFDGCDATHEFSFTKIIPPASVIKKFHAQGWLTGKRVRCPAHAHGNRRGKAMRSPQTGGSVSRIGTAASPAAMTSPVAITTANADAQKRRKRLIIQALEDAYDDQANGYRPGHSDATIAVEIDCAIELVAKLREELFGPLGEPSEIGEIRDTLAQCKRDRETATNAFNQAIEAARNRYETDMNGVIKQEQAIATRLDALALKNGWRG